MSSLISRTARRAVLVGTIATLAGCSLFGSDKPKPAPLPVISGPSAVEIAWRQRIGNTAYGFQPAYADGSVWAAAQNGRVYRFDAATGKPQWEVDLKKPLLAGVGTDGRLAVVASRDGQLIALGADGKTRWTAPIGSEAVAVPVVGEGLVAVRTSASRISAFDAETGKPRWSYQRQNPPLVLRQTQTMAIDAGVLYVGLPGGRLVGLSVDTGAVRWESAVSQPRGSNEIERIADVVGSVSVIDSRLCAATYQGRFGCFDAATGRPAWVRDLASSTGPSQDGRSIVVIDDKEAVHLFSRTGSSVWRNQQYALRGLSAPLLMDDVVLFGDTSGAMHALTRDDGKPVGRIGLDSAILSAPVRADALAIVQTSSGSVYGLRVAR